jgi:hypothetical protein
MNVEFLKDFFLWGFILNLSLLFIWFAFFVFAKDFVLKIHNNLFGISEQQFNIINYSMMGAFKLLIYGFMLVPYIALCIID